MNDIDIHITNRKIDRLYRALDDLRRELESASLRGKSYTIKPAMVRELARYLDDLDELTEEIRDHKNFVNRIGEYLGDAINEYSTQLAEHVMSRL